MRMTPDYTLVWYLHRPFRFSSFHSKKTTSVHRSACIWARESVRLSASVCNKVPWLSTNLLTTGHKTAASKIMHGGHGASRRLSGFFSMERAAALIGRSLVQLSMGCLPSIARQQACWKRVGRDAAGVISQRGNRTQQRVSGRSGEAEFSWLLHEAGKGDAWKLGRERTLSRVDREDVPEDLKGLPTCFASRFCRSDFCS